MPCKNIFMFSLILVRRLLIVAAVVIASWPSAATAMEFRKASLVVATAADVLALEIEVARTSDQRSQGLMFRTELAPDAGMLFIYDSPGTISMWMKNTILSLDMLFIAGDGRITRIVANTIPMSETIIGSRDTARAVLELNAGAARRLGIKTGDRIDLTPFLSP